MEGGSWAPEQWGSGSWVRLVPSQWLISSWVELTSGCGGVAVTGGGPETRAHWGAGAGCGEKGELSGQTEVSLDDGGVGGVGVKPTLRVGAAKGTQSWRARLTGLSLRATISYQTCRALRAGGGCPPLLAGPRF